MHIAVDGDLVRVRPLLATFATAGVFGLGALVRYPDTATEPGRSIVAGVLVTLVVLGGAGLRAAGTTSGAVAHPT